LFEGSRIQQLRDHESPAVNGKVDLLAKKGLEMSKSLAQAEKHVSTHVLFFPWSLQNNDSSIAYTQMRYQMMTDAPS
jgi:hypothetical protein